MSPTTAILWGARAHADDGSMLLRLANGRSRAEQLRDGPYAQLAHRAAAAMDPPPATCAPSAHRLVHGDLHPGQLLLDRNGRLAGIIDWDEASLGDPAFDLQLAYAFLPPSVHPEFWALYGAVEAAGRARHIALSTSLAILAQAVSDRKPKLATEAAFNLHNILASPTP
jgi:hypothetical protein